MNRELILEFPTANQVIICFEGEMPIESDFESPLIQSDLDDIRWYLEDYAAKYAQMDDESLERAKQIRGKLQEWGKNLFEAVFNDHAQELFDDRHKDLESLIISTSHAEILSLPWELLYNSKETYLLHDNPPISIRRRFDKDLGTGKVGKVRPKDRICLLFVISRPRDRGFIDPRADTKAVLKALDEEAPGRVTVEFLRPPTLGNLVSRIEQSPVDMIHFDGHGIFNPDGSSETDSTGCLLFEKEDGDGHAVPAKVLGDMLNRKEVGLIVLSACQSATMGSKAMGSVAARLTHAGIPAVLAMTHSVLVETAHRLFANFYKHLASGKSVGESLDHARRYLYLDAERGKQYQDKTCIKLELSDWFLPALYHAGQDVKLLTKERTEPINDVHWGNLPDIQEAGFFGRRQELWKIEQCFVKGTRRITLSGPGGQGKTSLALEAGTWLYRTKMFQKICLVDYSDFHGTDTVEFAISNLRTLSDAEIADDMLAETPTLMILDGLETLRTKLPRLLDAAKKWSETGECRVLLTTDKPDFGHPDYSVEGVLEHRCLELKGLEAEDTFAYFRWLWELPPASRFGLPTHDILSTLFKKINYHPMSVGLLAREMKERRLFNLSGCFEPLIAETPDNPLLACLKLSLDRLNDEVWSFFPHIEAFQGGVFEEDLSNIGQFSEERWHELRILLETANLIQTKRLPDGTYFKFHPALTVILRSKSIRLTETTTEEKDNPEPRKKGRFFILVGVTGLAGMIMTVLVAIYSIIQPLEIEGNIYFKADGSPVKGATISIPECSECKTGTDQKGNFILELPENLENQWVNLQIQDKIRTYNYNMILPVRLNSHICDLPFSSYLKLKETDFCKNTDAIRIEIEKRLIGKWKYTDSLNTETFWMIEQKDDQLTIRKEDTQTLFKGRYLYDIGEFSYSVEIPMTSGESEKSTGAGKVNSDGSRIEGKWHQQGFSGEFVLERISG